MQEPVNGSTYNRSTLVDSVVESQDYTEVKLSEEVGTIYINCDQLLSITVGLLYL